MSNFHQEILKAENEPVLDVYIDTLLELKRERARRKALELELEQQGDPPSKPVHASGGSSFTTTLHKKKTMDSLQVSGLLGKVHSNVLKTIEHLDCPEHFFQENFKVEPYSIPTGNGGTRTNGKKYRMTNKGFAFLLFKFNGEKAMEWKLKILDQLEAITTTTTLIQEAG